MKSATWDSPNKMHFESDYETFNKQTNLISRGNVLASTQYSNYIRPYNEVRNYSYVGRHGDFMRFDMKLFKDIPERMRTILEDKDRTGSYILYEFFTQRNGERDIVGYVLTDNNHNFICDSVRCGYRQRYWKRRSVIDECKKYVCN